MSVRTDMAMATVRSSTISFQDEVREILYDLEFGSEEYFEEVVRTLSPQDTTNLTINERFGSLSIFKQPLQLIKTDEDNKLTINDQVMEQLSCIDVPLNIVAICGHYRTGKSYLMNRLANETTGFQLGSTVTSQTKGIWVWCKQHPKQEDQVLLLLDTEGLSDVQKADVDHDNKLFCLAVLLSSTLIYNNIGVFDNDSLEKLSFITTMTESVRISKDETISDEDNDETIRLLTPTFVMCLRDFFLELKNGELEYKDADDYFEFTLENLNTTERVSNDRTRECIMKYFPKRKCFTVAQPAMNKKLSQLETLPDKSLDEDFLQDVEKLRGFVYDCPPKVLDAVTKKLADGRVFEAFARTYVEALAEGDTMTFTKAYEQASAFHNSKLAVEMSHQYRQELDQIQLPFPKKQELQEKCMDLIRKKLRLFRKQFYPYKLDYFEEKARDKMEAMQKEKMAENFKEVQLELAKKVRILHKEMTKDFNKKYNKTFGLTIYKQALEDLEMKFRQQTTAFDHDERNTAFLTFKKNIKDEKLKVEFMTKLREEEERNEKLRKEVQESLQFHFQKQLDIMKQEKENDLKEQLKVLEENFTEAMGTLKGKSFWKKFKLLFG